MSGSLGNGSRRRRPQSIAQPAPVDRRLLRRASAVIAVQTAVAAAAVVAIVIALVYSLSQQERRDASEHKLEDKVAAALADAGFVEDSPDGVTDGAAEGDTVDVPPDAAAVSAVLDDMPTADVCREARDIWADQEAWAREVALGISEVDVCGEAVLVYAAERDGTRAVAAMSFAEQQEETARLARLSILAGLAGVLAAAGIGWLVARSAVRPLGDALASQRRFVADASHELRTPLAILHTRAQLLQRRPARDPEQHREIDQLVDDARVLTDIVNDLLLSAEMQHRPESRQAVELSRIAAELADSFAGTAEESGVDLVVDTEAGTRYVVTGAPSALRRAVAALIDNAFRHVARGGTITLSLGTDGRFVRVSVVDDGEGFYGHLAAELTQRFARGPNASGDGHRLGLGLALVEEVVHAHDGAMTIDGRPGDGATVTLTFPAAP